MPFSEAEKSELLQLIGEALTPVVKEMSDRTNSTVSGAVKRVLGEAIEPINTRITSLAEDFGGFKGSIGEVVKTSMDSLLEEYGSADEPAAATQPPAQPPARSNPAAVPPQEFSSFDIERRIRDAVSAAQDDYKREYGEQLKRMQNRLSAAEKIAEEERTQRERIAEQNRIKGMQDRVIGYLSGRVIPGRERRLMNAMIDEGVLVEDRDSGQYRIKGRDKYGEETLLSIETSLQDLLRDHYGEYVPSRPGTGTGATSGRRSDGSHPNYQYFNSLNLQRTPELPDERIMQIAGDDKAFNELTRELSDIINS